MIKSWWNSYFKDAMIVNCMILLTFVAILFILLVGIFKIAANFIGPNPNNRPPVSYETYNIVQKLEAQTKHDEAHFDRIETMIQQLNDRVAASEEKQNERNKK